MSLKIIAKELGLSLTTVSRALNGYPEVSAQTRVQVLAAAQRHQYRPNAGARGLALGRAEAVGVVFPITPTDLGDAMFLHVTSAMSERLAQAGLDLLIISASARDELQAYKRTIAAHRVDAFVVPRTRQEDDRLSLLQAQGVPFVAYGRSAQFDQAYAWLDFDNQAGARMATERLLAFGHRRLAYLGAPPMYNFAADRYAGFCAALEGARLPQAPDMVQRVAMERRSGYTAMQELLTKAQPPTAVLVDNNLAGVGAVHAALNAGCTLGQDLSVIVYDGLGADSLIRSPITSVEQPTAAKVGEVLAELVLARLSGEPPEQLTRQYAPVLLLGESDGPLKAG